MTQEQKPKKKKVSLMSVLGDPGKAVAELMDDPDIIAKLPEILAKCPPSAMKVLACSIAPYLLPTKFRVDEVSESTPGIPRPLFQEDILKTVNAIPKEVTIAIDNVDELSEIRKQLGQLADSIKAIQDNLPSQIKTQVSIVVKSELATFQKQFEAKDLDSIAK